MISILCPSRGRPTLAKNLVQTALLTAASDIEILIYVNDDDIKLNEYQELINKEYLIVGKDRSPNHTWNALSRIAKHDIMFLVSDDAWFETPGWDIKVLEIFNQYKDKIAFVYPSIEGLPWKGGTASPGSCPHYFLHKNWINTVGYFVPPQFWHWFSDWYWKAVAEKLGRVHCTSDIKVPCNLEYVDETEKRKDIFCNRERDIWIWSQPYTRRHIENDAQILKSFIESQK